jgi:hypothetical protein
LNKSGVLIVDNFLGEKWNNVGESGKEFLILPSGSIAPEKKEKW